MKTLSLVAISFLFTAFTACEESPSIDSLNGQWRLVHYYNLETKTSASAPADLAKSITLNFSSDGLAGTFTGHTFINQLQGSYKLTLPGKINMTSTHDLPSHEMELGKIIVDGIQSADAYKVSSYSLNLYFHESKEVLIFVRL